MQSLISVSVFQFFLQKFFDLQSIELNVREHRHSSPRARFALITWFRTRGSGIKTSLLGNRGNVARAMQHPDNHYSFGGRHVVDCVGIMECHPEPRCELRARRSRVWKLPQWLTRHLNRLHEAGGSFGRRFSCKVEPDFGEVVFRRVGQVERERSANSFLPR